MGSSKKRSTVGYYYFLGFHLIFCHGPIDRATKYYADKKIAWQGETTGGTVGIFSLGLFGGNEKEGGIGGLFDFEFGKLDQVQNSYLTSKVYPQLVPAFRGLFGVIARQVYIGTTTYLKNMAVFASRIHVRTANGIEQWYDEKAEIGFSQHADTLTIAYDDYTGPNLAFTRQAQMTFDDGTYLHLFVVDTPTPNFIYRYKILKTDLSTYSAETFPDDPYWPNLLDGSGDISACVQWGISSVDGVTPAIFLLDYTSPPVSVRIIDASAVNDAATGWEYMTYSIKDGKFFLCVEFGTGPDDEDGGSSVYDLNNAFNVATLVYSTDMDGPYGSDSDIHLGTNFYYTLTRKGYVCCYSKTWDLLWATPFYAHLPPPLRKIGAGNDIYMREESDGVVVLRASIRFVRVSKAGAFLMGDITSTNYPDTAVDNHGGALFDVTNGKWYSLTPQGATGHTSLAVYNLHSPAINGDMNPAHIIRECLTDPDWGMGYQDGDIDNTSFTLAADTLWSEGFGLSLLWSKQTTIEQFITEVIKHIDASLYLDRTTGKFVLKLIRDDFSTGSLTVLDESIIEKIDNFVRPTTGELTNSVTVQYWDTENNVDASVTVQDIALVQMQQATISATLPYPGITRAPLASRVAQRDLKTLSTPIASCTLYCNQEAAGLNIGDPFKLSWADYDIVEMVMRVTGIAFGDGRKNQVRITCTQDIYKLPTLAMIIPDIAVLPPVNPVPFPITKRLPYEIPYLEAVQQLTQATVDAAIAANAAEGYVGVAIGSPVSGALNGKMYVDVGAGYEYQTDINFAPTAKLATAIVSKTQNVLTISDAVMFTSVPAGSWFQIGTELFAYLSTTAPNTISVKRGVLDTVPVLHDIGARLYFWDVFSTSDDTAYETGEDVNIKVTSITGQGELALASAPVDTLTIVGRMARPYPPANVTLNSDYDPETLTTPVTIEWADRNRKTQTGSTLLGYYDGSVALETGVTYNIRLFNATTEALIFSDTGITAPYDLTIDNTLPQRIELESIRDGLTSYQFYSHTFNVGSAPGAGWGSAWGASWGS